MLVWAGFVVVLVQVNVSDFRLFWHMEGTGTAVHIRLVRA
jgi:hypothetical protein